MYENIDENIIPICHLFKVTYVSEAEIVFVCCLFLNNRLFILEPKVSGFGHEMQIQFVQKSMFLCDQQFEVS